MSEGAPNKKLKHTNLLSPKKETDTDSENEKTSQDGNTDQEGMDDSKEKAAKVVPSKHDLPQNAKRKIHTFHFRFKNNTYALTCDTSMTVIEALNTSNIFKNILKKYTDKELIIQRSKGKVPRAAVKTDFPCCLIERDEILKIHFMGDDGSQTKHEEKPTADISEPDSLVTFYIRTTGMQKIKLLMKNKEVRLNIDDACVYAVKEENIKSALERDGRFIDDIYTRCALKEMDSEIIYEMTNIVDPLHQKHFQAIVINDFDKPDGQAYYQDNQDHQDDEDKQDDEDNLDGTAEIESDADPRPQLPISIETEKTPKKRRGKAEEKSVPKMIIPNSEETLKFLRAQFTELMKKLNQREDLKNNSEVQEFFREEYDKSVQSFMKVRKVKEIMRLSKSVCQIIVNGSPKIKATGFLLFDQFILTNAHAIKNYDLFTWKIHDPVYAIFDFEKSKQGFKVQVKETLAAYHHGQEGGNHFDFALLELNDKIDQTYPRLLECYSKDNCTNTGEVCIVGHPDGGVKKTDPCFVIGREDRQKAEAKHVSENMQFYHVITKQSMTEKWSFHKNQVTYNSCFFHGSSGSPVFDRKCRLIGIHTGGYAYPGENQIRRSVMEYAYAIQPILDKIITLAESKNRTDIVDSLKDENTYLKMTPVDQEMAEVS